MPDGDVLVRFAEAAVQGSDDLGAARLALIERVGRAGAGQAAATVGAFSGLVRVADGTGIPLDDGMAATSTGIRQELGLDRFSGAANTDIAGVVPTPFTTVDELWTHRR